MRMTKEFDDPPKPFRREPWPENLHLGWRKPVRKRATNVTVDEDILAAAKEMGINLSQTLEDELRKRVTEARTQKWREENREAIESYNRFIDRNGVFGEEFQDWDELSV